MPDAWETAHGLNPADAADGPKDKDGDGYTNIEEFLNETDPNKPDTGVPASQPAVTVQGGNEAIRGEAARRLGAALLASEIQPQAAPASRDAFLEKVRQGAGDVAAVLGLQFARIPPGEISVFKVKVTLTKPFDLATREVTQAQWEAVMGTRPWQGQLAAKDGPDLPVTYVSRIDCEEFVARLNACGGDRYRLPTQCEWLHAASAGTKFEYGFPTPATQPGWLEYDLVSLRYRDEAGYHETLADFPEPVGQRKPNPNGLFNLAGNVSEWCYDWFSYQYYDERAEPSKTDPMGPDQGEFRIVCGGNFRFGTNTERVWTFRRPHYRDFGLGFRLYRAVE
jgi:hypothetical protein